MSRPRLRLETSRRTPEGLWKPDPAALHHLIDVRRCGDGDAVEGLLPGRLLTLRLEHRADGWYARELRRDPVEGAALSVYLLAALVKTAPFEQMLRQATQLGVRRILPLSCDRSVVRLEAGRLAKKMERWERLIAESSKQCALPEPPSLEPPKPLTALDEGDIAGLPLAAIIDGHARPLGAFAPREAATVAIGPEGDFSDREKAHLRNLGFRSVSLGSTILKAETAAVAACSYLLLQREAESCAS
ncbi:MAG: 16S rRNA (uracil(1498)-N(3))-methyltransferase [Synergistales bacterium]|nr:16S rRNA (uracil(1498)-N(3))-methyltransferase [Synergistales bacterium]